MNKIEITGKITGELQYAQYPNGNKIVNFGFESFSKRRVNKFRVSASGKKVEIIEKAAEKSVLSEKLEQEQDKWQGHLL